MAYKNLTDAVDILCEVVFGIAGGVGHTWNIIQKRTARQSLRCIIR